MNLHINPAEFSDVIQAAVDRAIAKMRAEQPAETDGQILLNKQGAADALSVSQSTVDRLRREAGLPCVKLDGLVLFRPEALREWAAAKETEKCESNPP